MPRSALVALLAAALFGASTPLAKSLLGQVPPLMLAALLYLGSGLGLLLARLLRDRGWTAPGLAAGEGRWLAGAILFGGVLGPVALMFGLSRTSGAAASLLLNLEAVLTALIAWRVFRENAGHRVIAGMLAIVAGGLVLAWPEGDAPAGHGAGSALVAAAALCWAIDNNLTRKVSASDALFIAGTKGLVAGGVNGLLALALGAAVPAPGALAAAMGVGLAGYGVSLVLFVLALRELGTARTGAYFSTAPFIGALLSLLWLGEAAPPALWAAGLLMAVGVWLHLGERHDHRHTHDAITHRHPHRHDAHHQHPHNFPWDGSEPHSHAHRHAPLTHKHPHYPDIHHRHRH
ncbi:MAG: EamA family transporter [Rhodocyclaceae bacterium]|nr:EamA family transporter [Rhodocyclaceae bacterium]